MRFFSSTDFRIASAVQGGSLLVRERKSRYGLGRFISIEDDAGVIEVADDLCAAESRIRSALAVQAD